MREVRIFLIILSTILFLSSGTSLPLYELAIDPPVGPALNRDIFHIPEPEKNSEPPRRNVPEQYQALFTAASAGMGLPPGVLESIAHVESGFRANAQSPIRCDGYSDLGMFQFNDQYLGWYSHVYNGGILFDPFDPDEAIWVAARHVRFLYERYGHWPDVVMAYNAGMDRIDKNEIPDSAWDYLLKIYREDR